MSEGLEFGRKPPKASLGSR